MNKRALIGTVVDLLLVALLIPLSGDLLYLYYAGGWYDPRQAVEIAEITVLYVIISSSLVRLIYLIRRLSRKSLR